LNPANLSMKRQWVAELARNKPVLFSLHHDIDLDWMKEAYRLTRKDGAAGIDGVTAADYEAALEANLLDLLDRIKSGRYHAPPPAFAGPTSRKRTARNGRSASRPSRTKACPRA
jgi:RNA-directed DNA polymerase